MIIVLVVLLFSFLNSQIDVWVDNGDDENYYEEHNQRKEHVIYGGNAVSEQITADVGLDGVW